MVDYSVFFSGQSSIAKPHSLKTALRRPSFYYMLTAGLAMTATVGLMNTRVQQNEERRNWLQEQRSPDREKQMIASVETDPALLTDSLKQEALTSLQQTDFVLEHLDYDARPGALRSYSGRLVDQTGKIVAVTEYHENRDCDGCRTEILNLVEMNLFIQNKHSATGKDTHRYIVTDKAYGVTGEMPTPFR